MDYAVESTETFDREFKKKHRDKKHYLESIYPNLKNTRINMESL